MEDMGLVGRLPERAVRDGLCVVSSCRHCNGLSTS